MIVIPARQGTKDKAMWELGGKPLVGWAVSAIPLDIDAIVVTDSEAVKSWCHQNKVNCKFRPWWLSTPSSLVIDLINYVTDGIDVEYVCLVQPTSPFVLPIHIDACVEAITGVYGFDSVETVIPVQHNAHWMNQRTMNGFIFKHQRAQNSQGKPTAYQFGNCLALNIVAMTMRQILMEPSLKIEIEPQYGIDIDTEYDLQLAKAMLDTGMVDLKDF